MKKKRKKYIYSEEQKAKLKIYQKEWAKKNKAKNKIYKAEYHLKNKAKAKIDKAKWYQDNKEEKKRQSLEWYKNNPGKAKAIKAKFKKNNPDYVPPCAVDLGYWVVYLIHNYNGLGDTYCGQTMNIYMRMAKHKSLGKLNTDTYTIVKKCDTLEDALEIESAVHNFGYHGYNNGI